MTISVPLVIQYDVKVLPRPGLGSRCAASLQRRCLRRRHHYAQRLAFAAEIDVRVAARLRPLRRSSCCPCMVCSGTRPSRKLSCCSGAGVHRLSSVYPNIRACNDSGCGSCPFWAFGSIWTGLAFEPRQMSRVVSRLLLLPSQHTAAGSTCRLATGEAFGGASRGQRAWIRLVGCVALGTRRTRRCDSAVAAWSGADGRRSPELWLHTACRFS